MIARGASSRDIIHISPLNVRKTVNNEIVHIRLFQRTIRKYQLGNSRNINQVQSQFLSMRYNVYAIMCEHNFNIIIFV